jgi:hypothetical protein
MRGLSSAACTLLAAAVACISVGACQRERGRSVAPSECVAGHALPIYGAQPEWLPPDMRPQQALAIGAIEDGAGHVGCTGVLIDRQLVITAKHCDRMTPLWFATGGLRALAAARILSDEFDAMLLVLDQSDADQLAEFSTPFTVGPESPSDAWVARQTTLGGLGESEQGTRGERLFVNEAISMIDPVYLIVDGAGHSGACAGDSGGPLFEVSPQGEAILLGVLKQGSGNCLGLDYYTRIDRLSPWLSSAVARLHASSCADLGLEGTCRSNVAHWCEAGQLQATACVGKARCGRTEQGTRCVDTEQDPCIGLGGEWTCIGDLLSRCAEGTLEQFDCTRCGARCRAAPEAIEPAECQQVENG